MYKSVPLREQGASFRVRYVDFGKKFTRSGATDFKALDYSDEQIRRPHVVREFMNKLDFPENTPFKDQFNRISVALLAFIPKRYLFVQIQRRREGEFSRHPRTNRPFNQIRFTFLTRERIEEQFKHRRALFTGLLYDAAQHGTSRRKDAPPFSLKDYYSQDGAQNPGSVLLHPLDLRVDEASVRFIVNALVEAVIQGKYFSKPTTILTGQRDLLEKLRLIQAAQYWLFPYLGVVTFALDYVTEQNVRLRFFDTPPELLRHASSKTYSLNAQNSSFSKDYYLAIKTLEPVWKSGDDAL